VEILLRLAKASSKVFEERQADSQRNAAAAAAAELAVLSPPQEAAAALCYRGIALAALGKATEAREALIIGLALAEVGEAKPQVRKRLEQELNKLPEGCEGEDYGLRVVKVSEAADAPGDPHCRMLLLGLDDGEEGDPLVRWWTLPCPEAFAWLRCGELAASATPKACHLPALEAL
ncbi:unnamed protein product, partial [Polarella glacialis]